MASASDRIDQAATGLRTSLAENGFCIIPNVLDSNQVETARTTLWHAVERLRAAGQDTHSPFLDPNDANVRVYHLPDHDPLFVELLSHPVAMAQVESLLGAGAIVSNFTANIARPGAGAMKVHSDMALVVPPPWHECWSMNVIWCLDDIREENGATRYLPGSHRFTRIEDVPADCESRMRSFEAKAGSIIIMDGRVWHSSGVNSTPDEDRALMFAYYTRPFIRQQVNWHEVLSPAVIASLDAGQRQLLGFGALANYHGAQLVLIGDMPSV